DILSIRDRPGHSRAVAMQARPEVADRLEKREVARLESPRGVEIHTPLHTNQYAANDARDTGDGPAGTNLRSVPKAVPGPAGDPQAVRNVGLVLVVHRHRRVRRPREIVVEGAPELGIGDHGIVHRLVETRDRAAVHLLVRTVAAVQPDHR